VALAVLLSLGAGCLTTPAQIYIPLAYAAAGLCIALLIYPTAAAAVAGFLVGGLIGAAVYNNVLKHQLAGRRLPDSPGP
jgi:hypothetical protein